MQTLFFRNISIGSFLWRSLDEVAIHNSGKVPLHGRLFAQWLHFAFPHDCPYPTIVESNHALTASQWIDASSGTKSMTASTEEKQKHQAQPLPDDSEFNIHEKWSDV